jgi:hypothetical protein
MHKTMNLKLQCSIHALRFKDLFFRMTSMTFELAAWIFSITCTNNEALIVPVRFQMHSLILRLCGDEYRTL